MHKAYDVQELFLSCVVFWFGVINEHDLYPIGFIVFSDCFCGKAQSTRTSQASV